MIRALHMAALGLVLGLASCERRTEEIDVGFQGEARSNPLLAAQRTLERLGTESRIQYGLGALPAPGEEVLLTEVGELRSRAGGLMSFLGWVEEGGQAIVCLDGFGSSQNFIDMLLELEEDAQPTWMTRPNALLSELGIERAPDSDVTAYGYGSFDEEVFSVAGRESDGVLVADGSPGAMVDTQRGAGTVTVLTTGRFFNNQELADEDHAVLLDALVNRDGERHPLVIAFASSESLGALLLDRAPYALISAGLLLLLWLWRSWPRFGPVEELDVQAMAGFTTHTQAVGRFLWRHDQGPALLASTRGQIIARVDARIPELHGASREALCDALAERTTFSAPEVDTLLHSRRRLRPSALAPTLQALARLRAEI